MKLGCQDVDLQNAGHRNTHNHEAMPCMVQDHSCRKGNKCMPRKSDGTVGKVLHPPEADTPTQGALQSKIAHGLIASYPRHSASCPERAGQYLQNGRARANQPATEAGLCR